MGGNFPGQSVTLWGQPIQVAACGSHSAGMTYGELIGEKPVLDARVRVRAAVAQERPVAAYFLDPVEVDVREHQRLILTCLGDDDPEWITDEGVAPEFYARALAAELLEPRSEEHTSELQSPCNLVCRLLLEKKKRAS